MRCGIVSAVMIAGMEGKGRSTSSSGDGDGDGDVAVGDEMASSSFSGMLGMRDLRFGLDVGLWLPAVWWDAEVGMVVGGGRESIFCYLSYLQSELVLQVKPCVFPW